jgi:hypothetical protein
MKKYIALLLLIGVFFAFAPQESMAQKKRSSGIEQYLDESGTLKDKIWFGGGFNLGFNGNDFYSLFSVGISPLVGYKIIEPLSVGPRVSLNYTWIRGIGTDGNIHSVQPIDYSVGVFSRLKFLQSLFAHVEYSYESAELPYFSGPYLLYDVAMAEVLTERIARDNFFVGLGYNSNGGGRFGFEIYLLYNVLQPANTINLPIEFRMGMTYNF